jgi:hypothetical protein
VTMSDKRRTCSGKNRCADDQELVGTKLITADCSCSLSKHTSLSHENLTWIPCFTAASRNTCTYVLSKRNVSSRVVGSSEWDGGLCESGFGVAMYEPASSARGGGCRENKSRCIRQRCIRPLGLGGFCRQLGMYLATQITSKSTSHDSSLICRILYGFGPRCRFSIGTFI